MKFLVDNQLPAELARWIGAKGCDACHALDVGLARSSDNEVFQYAQSASRILISKDEDFLHLALRSDTAGFVWVRLGNCRKTQLLKALNGLGRILWNESTRASASSKCASVNWPAPGDV